jgi:hypothetical protein
VRSSRVNDAATSRRCNQDELPESVRTNAWELEQLRRQGASVLRRLPDDEVRTPSLGDGQKVGVRFTSGVASEDGGPGPRIGLRAARMQRHVGETRSPRQP